MTFNTGNPIGSTDPRDLSDNAAALDLSVNSSTPTFIDRLGRPRKTLHWMEEAAMAIPAIKASAAAETAANRAEVASDAAQMAAGIYADVAAGLSGTVDGGYFSVPSDNEHEYLTLYKNEGSNASYVASYPNAALVKSLEKDPLRPRSIDVPGLAEALLAAITDASGQRTWLEARQIDGGPSQWATQLLRGALGLPISQAPGVLAAVVDAQNRLTDLTVRQEDGQVPDWVIERWASRIAPILAGPGSVFGTSIVDAPILGSDIRSLYPDMKSIAGWGSSSMEYAAADFSSMSESLGAKFYAGGKGGEWSSHIAARIGSIPAKLTVNGGVIPASGAVNVSCSNMSPSANLLPFDGYLSGIRGTLSSSNTQLVFSRLEEGDAITVLTENEFIPIEGPKHRSDVTLLWMGKNDLISAAGTADGAIRRTDLTFDWLAPIVKRCLVMGHFVNTGVPEDSVARKKIYEVNAAYAARYGRLYVDVQSLLVDGDIWGKIGITPTQDDLDQQAMGNKPPSLSRDEGHMNSTADAYVCQVVLDRLKLLNWY